jgi:hypothetical protein
MLTESARFPSKFLLTALALSLTACAKPSTTLPPPPTVRCEQPWTKPVSASPVDWWKDGPAWAAEVLGALREERALRRVEHGCLDELRKRGVIR